MIEGDSMDFIEHAQILIQALTGLNMTIWDGCGSALTEFEEHFCFSPEIQRLYTRAGLEQFFERKGRESIYVISEPLDTNCILLHIDGIFDGIWIILGPYVTDNWKSGTSAALLARCGLQESDRLPYKIYRCELPVIETAEVVRTAVLLLANTVGNIPPRELEIINLEDREPDHLHIRISSEREDAATVTRRYTLENKLIDAIRDGHTQEAITHLDGIMKLNPGLSFMTPNMKDQIAGAAILRTLGRRAAVQAGLIPVLIDSISQEYAQRMHKAVEEAELRDLMERFIASMCLAVRECKRSEWSPAVRKAVQYIQVHLSESISIDTLCRFCGVSRKQFVHTFAQETGKTIKQYVMAARCERAAELLSNSRLMVQDISAYVGYEDNNYFAKVFKGIYGVTPQEYRKVNTIL